MEGIQPRDKENIINYSDGDINSIFCVVPE